MDKLLKELTDIIDSGYAPAQGLLTPNHDIVHDYYNRLVNVIRNAEQNAEPEPELLEILESLANDADELPEDSDIVESDGFYTKVDSTLLVQLHKTIKQARTVIAKAKGEPHVT